MSRFSGTDPDGFLEDVVEDRCRSERLFDTQTYMIIISLPFLSLESNLKNVCMNSSNVRIGNVALLCACGQLLTKLVVWDEGMAWWDQNRPEQE